MSRNQRCALLLAVLALTSIGCLGEPIPRKVVAGTSFTLPFNGGVFGVAPANAAGTPPIVKSDAQRGNIRFALCPMAGPCAPEVRLPVRYLSRMFPDRGSRLGLTGSVEVRRLSDGSIGSFGNFLSGETVVVIDVPVGTTATTYMLAAFTDPPGAPPETIAVLEPLEVVAGSVAMFSNIANLLNFSGNDGSPSLEGFVPYPQLSLVLSDTSNLDDIPASGSIVLRYPKDSVKIEGVFEGGRLGQGSVMRMFDGPDSDTVTLFLMDPDRQTLSLRVPFSLKNPAGPAVPIEAFSIVPGQSLFKLDGSVLPDTGDPAAAGNRFVLFGIN
jgi:hypothetical protein